MTATVTEKMDKMSEDETTTMTRTSKDENEQENKD